MRRPRTPHDSAVEPNGASQVSDTRTIDHAAERYGLTDPSPDDVLSARWPLYNSDAIHTKGYHRMYDLVMERIDESSKAKKCRRCGLRLEDGHGNNRRFCRPCAIKNLGNWRKRYGAPLEGVRADVAIELYLEGLSIKEVARQMHVGQCKIRATLRANDIDRRGYRKAGTGHGVNVVGVRSVPVIKRERAA